MRSCGWGRLAPGSVSERILPRCRYRTRTASSRRALGVPRGRAGSFSDASIEYTSSRASCWTFVRTEEESPVALPHIDALHAELDRVAPDAHRLIVPGAGHATHILEQRPAFTAELAALLASEIERCGVPRAG